MTSKGDHAPVTAPRHCKSCNALILWVKWERSGKSMPVDATPNPSGEVLLMLRTTDDGQVLIAEKLRGHAPMNRNRYTSHFDTCAHASQHRSR